MFMRKISQNRNGSNTAKTTPPLQKRSSMMCLPEEEQTLKMTRSPPVRAKLCKDKKAMSLESICHNGKSKVSTKECYPEHFALRQWSESFVKLLEDKMGVKQFLRYLESEHSSENIRFWIECEKYKRTSPDKLNEKARDMYNEYLCGNGSYQVNVDSCRVKEVKEELDKPNAWIFEKVQRDIFLLMKRDSYPRFLKSTQYANLITSSRVQR